MRPSLRFLALAIVGWTGIRAAALGSLPGAELFRIDPSQARPPPITPTEFPPIEPLDPAGEQALPPIFNAGLAYPAQAPLTGWQRPAFVPVPYQIPVSVPANFGPPGLTGTLPPPRSRLYASSSARDDWPLAGMSSLPPLQSSVVPPPISLPAPAVKAGGLDRLQLSSWALLRSQRMGVAGTPSLSSGGSLGASQAGARLIYNVTPQLAAVLRTSSEVGRRGGEVAAGVRVQPVRSIPLWLTAERRQRIGRFGGGRNDFALFFEAGLYDRPMPMSFLLDAYLEGGVVGLRRRDRFIDGGVTVTRPVYKQFSAGFGVWGGAQTGVARLDAGPRVTMRVRNNVKVHFDWRQRLMGKARPGSGAAVTLAGDF